MDAPHEPVASPDEEDTVTHHAAKRALLGMVMTVALAVPAVPAAASNGAYERSATRFHFISPTALHNPLVVPISSAEHATPDVMVAPASSSEHGAPEPSAVLVVPMSNTEHAIPDVLVAPTSTSEHSATGAVTALIVPVTSTEHRPGSTASVIATKGPATQSQDRWAILAAAAGLLLAGLVATAMVIHLQIKGRDVAV
jgi:hypothetical protein